MSAENKSQTYLTDNNPGDLYSKKKFLGNEKKLSSFHNKKILVNKFLLNK